MLDWVQHMEDMRHKVEFTKKVYEENFYKTVHMVWRKKSLFLMSFVQSDLALIGSNSMDLNQRDNIWITFCVLL